ncbi:bucky ball-like isoform X3 [Tachysurus fulvidraco]|uniref:bucky ball-like isoform X3 n=1 Tax=Tachysurus fulvidraco TaxID=1234273 RepID=UPI000F4EC704|nr:bucky ball-like isoform X3 [Tachysurus fulvidraco]
MDKGIRGKNLHFTPENIHKKSICCITICFCKSITELSKPSQPAAGERSGSHPRPFFYVQPAVQPFYTYQWQMNHPYSQQGFPGSAFHFGRPYMLPYSYMQYPGYVMPQASMHPVDYRRIHERSFPHAPGCDASLRQYQHGQAAPREMTCVGAQTDPSEALNKLIECLDQLRASDSSQTSGSLSPLTKEPKCEEESLIMGDKLISKSNMVDDDDRGTSCGGHATQEEDSSLASGREEEEKKEAGYHDCSESHSDFSQSHSPSGSCQEKNEDEKEQDKELEQTNEELEWNSCIASRPSSQSSPAHNSLTKKIENQNLIQKQHDFSCCILHLPFEKVISSGVYGASITPPSLGSPLNYTYHPPQLAHERVSVLSPSLDELSSHDELLSTDLDDIDLFPTRIYSRGKLAEVASRRCHSSDLCLLYPKRLTCAMCGSHTFKELSRTKICRYEDMEDSDEVKVKHRLRNTVGKGHTTRKTHSQIRHKLQTEHHREKAESQHESSRSEHLCCETSLCSTEKSPRAASARPERRCKVISDQLLRDGVRAKACRAQPLPQRPRCQSSRNEEDDNDEHEDEEQEVLLYPRTKGTTKRGGARC